MVLLTILNMDLQKQQEERQKFQDEAERLSLLHNNLLIEAATGCGKSVAALRAIKASRSKLKWLILVPEILLINNFIEDAKKNGFSDVLEEKIEDVICYASLSKWIGKNLNICADEAHRSTSELRLDYLKQINSEQRIYLSATIDTETKEKLQELGDWYVYQLSLKEAISRGILPKPDINIVWVELGDKQKKYPFKFGKKNQILTAKAYYDQLCKSFRYWSDRYKTEGMEFLKNKMLQAAMQRKKFLAEYKTPEAKKILDKIRGKRFICFCGSVPQAQQLGAENAVHSKNSKDKNQKIVEDFNSGKTNSLFANQMLKEGQNLSRISHAIILQLWANERDNIQALGRSLRAEFPEVYLIVVKNTKDQEYLEKFLELINYE